MMLFSFQSPIRSWEVGIQHYSQIDDPTHFTVFNHSYILITEFTKQTHHNWTITDYLVWVKREIQEHFPVSVVPQLLEIRVN